MDTFFLPTYLDFSKKKKGISIFVLIFSKNIEESLKLDKFIFYFYI